jgi:hypothetical protein
MACGGACGAHVQHHGGQGRVWKASAAVQVRVLCGAVSDVCCSLTCGVLADHVGIVSSKVWLV